MAEIRCSVLVDSDPGSVFDFVFDAKQRSFWQHDVVRGSGPLPEPVEGSTWTELRRIGTRELRIDVTVTEVVRPSLIRFVGEAGAFGGHGGFDFRRVGSRTEVVYFTEVQGRGLNALLTGLLARRARRIAQANLFRLTMHFPQDSRAGERAQARDVDWAPPIEETA